MNSVPHGLSRLQLGILISLALILSFAQLMGPYGVETWESAVLSEHLSYALSIQCLAWLNFGVAMYFVYRSLDTRSKGESLFRARHSALVKLTLVSLLLITRITWWVAPPSPSEDVWRYLWDGERVSQSELVYTNAPSKLRGIEVDSERIRERVGHAQIPTVYPPGAQVFFMFAHRLGSFFGGSIASRLTSWRFILLIAELLLLASLLSMTRRFGLSPCVLLPYVLCPLITFETALAAHLDMIGVALTAFALIAWARGKSFIVGIALGLAILIKFIPLIPLFILMMSTLIRLFNPVNIEAQKVTYRKLRNLVIGLCLIFVVVIYPFYAELSSFGGLWPGLAKYKEHWYFNGSIFPAIRGLLRTLPIELSEGDTHTLTQLILGGLVTVALGLATWIRLYPLAQSSSEDEASLQKSLSAVLELSTFGISLLLLCSPVLFTWYLLWIIPFSVVIVFVADRESWTHSLSLSAVIWGLMSLVTYHPRLNMLQSGEWTFPPILIFIEYGTLTLTILLIKRYTLPSRVMALSPKQTPDIE